MKPWLPLISSSSLPSAGVTDLHHPVLFVNKFIPVVLKVHHYSSRELKAM